MGVVHPLLEPVHALLVEAAVCLRRAPNRRDVDTAERLIDTCRRAVTHLGDTGRVAQWELASTGAAIDALADRVEEHQTKLDG